MLRYRNATTSRPSRIALTFNSSIATIEGILGFQFDRKALPVYDDNPAPKFCLCVAFSDENGAHLNLWSRYPIEEFHLDNIEIPWEIWASSRSSAESFINTIKSIG